MAPRIILNAMGKRKISCLCQESNPSWDKSIIYVKIRSKYNQTIPKRWRKGIIIYEYEVNPQNKYSKFELNILTAAKRLKDIL
jgi:hypothetical protein